MKVKTDYVPEDKKFYLTEGKEYEVTIKSGGDLKTIIGDGGGEVFIYIPKCAHLNNEPWEIVDET